MDWRTPSLDYHTLMKLTWIISRSNASDTEQMFRCMCFNVFAHKCDDHAKNLSWIYDPQQDCWYPFPAYDLTWRTTYFGEHTTTVDGNGKDPGFAELHAIDKAAGIIAKVCRKITGEIQEKTWELERRYHDCRCNQLPLELFKCHHI